MTAPLSLKGRALALLAQREQSVLELRRKLMRHAQVQAQAPVRRRGIDAGIGPAGETGAIHEADASEADAAPTDPAPQGLDEDARADARAAREDAQSRVDEVIAWLQANDFLSERRFVESRLHSRAARYGNQRIRAELSQHGVALSSDEAAALKHSELDRARDVWQRKFGTPAADAAGRARQARFLAGRGFSGDVVRRVVWGGTGAPSRPGQGDDTDE